MAFQPINFQPINVPMPYENPEPLYLRLQNDRQKMLMDQQALSQAQANSFIKDLEAKYAEKKILSDLEHQHARALNQQRMGMGISLGKGGQGAQKQYAPSNIGKLLNEQEAIISTYGENSPQALIMKAAIEKATMATGPKSGKYAPTNLGKLMQERDKAIEIYGPESEQAQAYDLQIQKSTTDADTRKRSLYASNLEKSMNSYDPIAITRYSGPGGAAKLKAEQLRDLAGHPSKEYLEYKDALVAAEFETSELRQFFGDSITPQVREHLNKLANPSSLGSSPEAAKRQLEKSRAIVRKQLETFRGGLKSKKEHLGPGISNTDTSNISKKQEDNPIQDDPFGVF